jgi:hypothetical protein
MAVSNVPIYPQTVVNAAVTIANADGTSTKTLRTGSTNGDKIESISITSDDTAAKVLNVYMNVGGTDYRVGTINVPAGAGTDAAATPAVSMLESSSMMPWVRRDSNGRGYLYLASGNILKVAAQATLTAGKTIYVVAHIGAF